MSKQLTYNNDTDELLPDTLNDGPQGAISVPLALVSSNQFQFRRHIAPESVNELAASISEHGLIQPIMVRPVGRGYEVVAGERRLRAMQLLNWQEAPATVRELSDEQAAFIMAVENVQREDFSIVDEAQMYERLSNAGDDGKSISDAEIARRLGRDNNRISRVRRLAKHPGLLADVAAGLITFMGAVGKIQVEDNRATTREALTPEQMPYQPAPPEMIELQREIDATAGVAVHPVFSEASTKAAANATPGGVWQGFIAATNKLAKVWDDDENMDPSALTKSARQDLIERAETGIQQLKTIILVLKQEDN